MRGGTCIYHGRSLRGHPNKLVSGRGCRPVQWHLDSASTDEFSWGTRLTDLYRHAQLVTAAVSSAIGRTSPCDKTSASLPTVKEIALKQIFFWEPRRRRIFWIHDVPKALENHAAEVIIRAHNWVLPWNSRIHQGLLNEMNAYRKEEEERKNVGVKADPEAYKYNVQDPFQYVKCISGAYTHADKLKGKILDSCHFEVSVDHAVQDNDPELFIVLYKLLRDAGIIQD
ncbi:hypothetical protein ACQ4PT_026500 [Festuca glaucescens]